MRIRVVGDNEAAKVLRGYLAKAGYALSERRNADYTVFLQEHNTAQLLLDSVDCELEANILKHVRNLTGTPVLIQTMGGIQSDREIRIAFPAADGQAVETGVLRGFLEFIPLPQPAHGWRKKLAAWIAGAAFSLAFALAQQPAPPPLPEPKPISLEDREATKTLQIAAYKQVVRMRDAQLMKAESEKEELQARHELARINAQIDKLAVDIRKRCRADETDWELTPDFRWVAKKPAPAPAATPVEDNKQ